MGVTLLAKTTLLEIRDDSVLVKTEDGEAALSADTVILAVGAVAVDDLAREVEGSGIQVIVIGDAKAPRRITEAAKEGFEAALTI